MNSLTPSLFGGLVLSSGLFLALWLRQRRSWENERVIAAQRQKQAAETEETLSLALEAASEYLWDGDLRTGRVSGSPQAGAWLGYPASEWPPDPWDTIVHEDDRAAVNAAIRRTIKGETRSYRIRHRLRRKDGTVLHALSTGVVVRDDAGQPRRFVGFVRDLTHEVLEEARQLQAQKLDGLGLLAGGIAHDFNNLLTVVSSSLDLARLHADGHSELDEPLQTAATAASRAAVLTRQLLAYAGRAPSAHVPLDFNEVVTAMGDLLSVSVPRKVTLVRALEPRLPAVQGDVAQLQQVVMNLVTNGAEAIGDAEGTLTLRTEGVATPSGKVVRLTVADTGRGMSAEVQSKIFDPFFSTKGSGRGLGLAALAGVLKAHAGTIHVESTLGQGTTITVELPALDAPLETGPRRTAGAGARALNLKVLLVDDEPMIRKAGRRLLEGLGCQVDEAETGRHAVERVSGDPTAWDVLLMDMTMPELSGAEAAQRIRAKVPALPIVLSSGYSTDAAQPNDGLFYLPKPYSLEQLEAVLRRATRAKGA